MLIVLMLKRLLKFSLLGLLPFALLPPHLLKVIIQYTQLRLGKGLEAQVLVILVRGLHLCHKPPDRHLL